MTTPRPATERGMHRLVRGLASGLVAAFAFVATAHAQTYPSKPVRMVATASPGGSIDTVARLVGQRLSVTLAQPVVIENRVGAGGNIGAAFVAKAPADGYTLMMGSSPSLAANTHLYANLTYDPLKDYAPVILVARQPNVLVVPPSLGVSNVKELLALAKSKSGKLSYGSGGVGNSQHIAAELLMLLTGTSMVHVPYKGSAPALVDLISGQIDVMLDTAPSAMPYIKSGQLRALAVTTAQRSPTLPDVPTLAEAGVSGYDYYGFLGMVAPAGTPKDIVARLNAEVQAMLVGELRPRLAELGLDVVGGPPEQLSSVMQQESAKHARIVKAANIVPQ